MAGLDPLHYCGMCNGEVSRVHQPNVSKSTYTRRPTERQTSKGIVRHQVSGSLQTWPSLTPSSLMTLSLYAATRLALRGQLVLRNCKACMPMKSFTNELSSHVAPWMGTTRLLLRLARWSRALLRPVRARATDGAFPPDSSALHSYPWAPCNPRSARVQVHANSCCPPPHPHPNLTPQIRNWSDLFGRTLGRGLLYAHRCARK